MSADHYYALTLYPQWAYAVAHLGKGVENRERWHEGTPQLSVARKLVGETILIHAAKGHGKRAAFGTDMSFIERTAKRLIIGARLPRMALIARATLADVAHTGEDGHRWRRGGPDALACALCGGRCEAGPLPPCPKADPWARAGVGLVLADVVPFEKPVPYPGRQGWFRVPAEVVG